MNKAYEILLSSRSIAVVGASPNPVRPSHWISEYLISAGYHVVPVNPGHEKLLGRTCYPDVLSIPDEIDIINIFRRSDQVLPIVQAALKRPELKLVWMQDNVYCRESAQLLEAAGIPVVMNDCIYRVHRTLT